MCFWQWGLIYHQNVCRWSNYFSHFSLSGKRWRLLWRGTSFWRCTFVDDILTFAWSKVAMIIHHLVTNCHQCVECLCICPSQNSPKTLTTLWPLHKLNRDFLPWFHNPAIIIFWQCKQWWWWWWWWLKCHKKLFPIFLFIPTRRAWLFAKIWL